MSLNDISDILKGPGGAKPAGQKGAANPSGLSQLSDAADLAAKTDVRRPAVAPAPPAPNHNHGHGAGLSQDPLIDAPQAMQFQQPSQTDIPPPVLPESQGGSQPAHLPAADELKGAVLPSSAAVAQGIDPSVLMGMMAAGGTMGGLALNMEQLTGMGGLSYYGLTHLHGEEEAPGGGGGGGNRSKGKKQTRRGPMDEMRQLIRILVKIFPQSIALIGNTDEAGGGNRISEEQIKNYIEKCLGEGPRPTWGVPNGWQGYMAELFSWAAGKVVSPDEAARVAKREPGRSWEALEGELHALGVHPSAWPLPLTLAGVREAEKNPVPLPIPALPAVKRGDGEGGAAAPSAGPRRSKTSHERDFNKLDEADLWRVINDALNVAAAKAGTGADPAAVLNHKSAAKARFEELVGGAGSALNPMYQYIALPNMAGLEGSANMLSMLQGALPVSSMQQFVDGDAAAALAAAAAAAVAAGATPEAAAAAAAAAAAGERPAKRARQGEHAGGGGGACACLGVPCSVGAAPGAHPSHSRRCVSPYFSATAEGEGGGTPSTEEDAEGQERAAAAARAPLSSTDARGALYGTLGGDQRQGALPLQPALNVGAYANSLASMYMNLAPGGMGMQLGAPVDDGHHQQQQQQQHHHHQ
jgi:hypothetical protein